MSDSIHHPRHQVDPPPEPARPPVVLPEHLEAFRNLITNTSGNDVDELLAIYHAPGERGARVMRTNLPVYLMGVMVGAQVDLLNLLHSKGLLRNPADGGHFVGDPGSGETPQA